MTKMQPGPLQRWQFTMGCWQPITRQEHGTSSDYLMDEPTDQSTLGDFSLLKRSYSKGADKELARLGASRAIGTKANAPWWSGRPTCALDPRRAGLG